MDCIRDTVAVPYPATGVTAVDGGNTKNELIPRGSSDPGSVIY